MFSLPLASVVPRRISSNQTIALGSVVIVREAEEAGLVVRCAETGESEKARQKQIAVTNRRRDNALNARTTSPNNLGQLPFQNYSSSSSPITRRLRTVGSDGVEPAGWAVIALVPTSWRNLPLAS